MALPLFTVNCLACWLGVIRGWIQTPELFQGLYSFGLHFCCKLNTYVPEVPRLVLESCDIFITLRVSQDKAVLVGILSKPPACLGFTESHHDHAALPPNRKIRS